MALPEADARQAASSARVADMRWLWGYVRRHSGSMWGANISGMIGGIASTAEPLLIGIIIDHLQSGVSFARLMEDVGVLLLLGLIALLAFFGMRHFSGTIAYAVNFEIRRDLYDNLLVQDNAFFQRQPVGDLLSRVHADTEMIWRLLAIGLNRSAHALFNLLTVFVLLALINLPLAVVVFIVLAVSTTFQLRAGEALTPMFESVQEQMGNMASVVQDAVSGVQTLKAFGQEESLHTRFAAQSREYRRRWLFFKRRNEPVGMLPNMISNLATAVVVFFGGVLTVQGAMTLGNFAQFLLYLGWITQSLLALGIIYQRYQQTRGAVTRLTLLLRETEISSPPDAIRLTQPRGDIRFEGVSVQSDGRWLLRDIDLDIPAGTVVGIVGETGGGKTLLINLLARVLDPTEGRVCVDGHDVRALDLADLRRAIAYVPQSTFLFSAPLRENIRMGVGNASDDDLMQAAEIARVTNDLPNLPYGMDTLVGEKGVMLSGGQKQRVAIARAVVRDPAILVLDDALSSVDTRTAADILRGLRGVLRKRTSIVIAHRIASVKDADRILVIQDGRIVEQGDHQTLIASGGIYARMAERELETAEDRAAQGEGKVEYAARKTA
jgi:ATP-binding cassette subfamily B protein